MSQPETSGTEARTSSSDVVIAGGGTAGWMAAAVLTPVMKASGRNVILIEPEENEPIGVGEASVVSIHSLLDALQIDEPTFLRTCSATFKLGIEFADWHRPGHSVWHPFGPCGGEIDGGDLFPFWHRARVTGLTEADYSAYSVNRLAAESGRSPHSPALVSPITSTRNYGYHFHSGLFIDLLKTTALNKGTELKNGTVKDLSLRQDGTAEAVLLADGTRIEGSLFIDATGFPAVLLSQVTSDGILDYSDRLLCDRAVTGRVRFEADHSSALASHTRSVSLDNGWMWQIPLQDSLGIGYVFSSAYLSDNEAADELAGACDSIGPPENVRFLPMPVFRRMTFRSGNVVAIGLSGGFTEPLESTGLHLTLGALEMLMKTLPPASGDHPAAAAEFNREMAARFDETADFIQLHYHLAGRSDTAFRQAAAAAPLSDSLRHRLRLYDEVGDTGDPDPEVFAASSWYYLLSGFERLPERVSPRALLPESHRVAGVLEQINSQNHGLVRSLIPHRRMLRTATRRQESHAS